MLVLIWLAATSLAKEPELIDRFAAVAAVAAKRQWVRGLRARYSPLPRPNWISAVSHLWMGQPPIPGWDAASSRDRHSRPTRRFA